MFYECEVGTQASEARDRGGKVVIRHRIPLRVRKDLERGSILMNICVLDHARTMEVEICTWFYGILQLRGTSVCLSVNGPAVVIAQNRQSRR